MTQHSHQTAPTQFVPAAKRTALVTGASGLAGGYMLEQGGWDIVAVSRRKPRIPGDYKYIAVDLLDPADCRSKLGPLTNISHLFYMAITERSDPSETVSANSNMFFNLVKTVEAASPALEHVHLAGHQWYGNHLGPYKTPTKEDDPRHMPPTFYYDQQDFLEEFQKGKRWTWSVGRPHAVCGFSTGGLMNLTLAIAVLRTSARHWGCLSAFQANPEPIPHPTNVRMPLFWQRPSSGWRPIRNARTRLSTSPTVILLGGRTYGPSSPISSGWIWLRHDTSTLRGPWPTRVRYGIGSSKRTDCRNTASKRLRLGATRTASDYGIVSDTSKARHFGFHDLVDTEEFLRMFSDFRRDRIIP
jgi:hypothetical protein